MNILKAGSLALPGIAHGFFGREGGVSDGIYASLNCGPGSRDAPEAVTENRRRVAAQLGAERIVSLSQVHSPIVHVVDAGWDTAQRPEGDGLVTATPGIALGILTADCAPVLFADDKARVIGAAHAGWKGALGGVLEATLAAMEQLGASRGRIVAAIGPCISQHNYEVGAEFRTRFLEAAPLRLSGQGAPSGNARFFIESERPGHYHFDLEGYVAARLAVAGVAAEPLSACTYPVENGFFSFRRTTHRGEPDYGREISGIVLKN
jgi:YfiH family protein